MKPSLWRRSLAEAVGTFALVVCGCGAIVVNTATGALGHVGVALSFGLVILVMIAALGHVSGAHWVYWLGPVLGATLGAALYQGLRSEPGTGR